MSSGAIYSGFDRFSLPLPQQCGPYGPSIASSASSSSQDSVFSADLSSTQSSVASSIADDFRGSQEDSRQQWLQQQAKSGHIVAEQQLRLRCAANGQRAHVPTYADVTSVPVEQRQHPRRSSWEPRKQKPPSLVRQCERKNQFVDNLVDSATQMVEVIWPLSVVPCRSEAGAGRGVLPLRTYIEETLKRSRTSYSTLQVALYYLILIRDFVPEADFTMEQQMDCPANRALMCGRRMFLSALILASKYLQDRNYSAKAWSKMSGLPVKEINTNERTFLGKIHWKLHIAEAVFKRWTDIVLKYTPSNQPPSPGQPECGLTWKAIVPMLTPELDRIPLPETKSASMKNLVVLPPPSSPATPTPTKNMLTPTPVETMSSESTPTPHTVLPRFLEPRPDIAPPTPALAGMGPLPTPHMTPSIAGSNTPAASVYGSRSMCSAMAMMRKAGVARCTMDAYPAGLPNLAFYAQGRRPSISTMSIGSSPESMVTDRTRSSRASSISSVSTVSTTSSMAPTRDSYRLARQATCRNAGRLPTVPAAVKEEKEGTMGKPIVIVDDSEMTSSPEVVDFTVSDKAMHAPHRHSKHAPHHAPAITSSTVDKGRKRSRPSRGNRRSDLQDEIRYQLEQDYDDDDMDIDDDIELTTLSPAAEYATRMLARSFSNVGMKEAQPSPMLTRRESMRIPMQKNDGKKRTCCSASAMSISPSPSALWGEVA